MNKYIVGFLFLGWWVHSMSHGYPELLESIFAWSVGVGFIILGLWDEYGKRLKKWISKN